MLNQIKLFFEQHLALSAPEKVTEHQLRLASVALLIEMTIMDDNNAAIERQMVLSLVEKGFELTPAEAETLVNEAEQQAKHATDYFQFTSIINKNCTLEQKVQLIESLWKVAYADGKLNPEEEYLVRKIADLLYVPHLDFIMAKNRVNQAIA